VERLYLMLLVDARERFPGTLQPPEFKIGNAELADPAFPFLCDALPAWRHRGPAGQKKIAPAEAVPPKRTHAVLSSRCTHVRLLHSY
jgi:hypothetical protein